MEEIHQAGYEVVAICVDPVEDNAKMASKYGLQFPILSDQELTATDAFGLRHVNGGFGHDIARPGVFLCDPQGKILWRRFPGNWRKRLRPEEILEVIREGTGLIGRRGVPNGTGGGGYSPASSHGRQIPPVGREPGTLSESAK